MNKTTVSTLKLLAPIPFAFGALGLIFSWGTSFKIQECYSKVDMFPTGWNFSKSIILKDCNSAQYYNSVLFWISALFIGIGILNCVILYFYDPEDE